MPVLAGSRGAVRLCYCTNVLPTDDLPSLERALVDVWSGVRAATIGERTLGLGLWLPAPLAALLGADPAALGRLRNALVEHRLVCFTLNAFPYGLFHAPRVKEDVYRPNWLQPDRLRYTLDCAAVLAGLLPDGEMHGTISTLPIAWRNDLVAPPNGVDLAQVALLWLVAGLARIADRTGRRIRVLLEPEPGCVLETTADAIGFLTRLDAVRSPVPWRDHLGLCFDCCHQAVVGEDLVTSLRKLRAARIPVGKLHLSSAIEGPLDDLRPYAEERYLHQTFATDGTARADDLPEALAAPAFAGRRVRTHFHVPIHVERLAGDLQTTAHALGPALDEVLAWDEIPDLEIETYTWSVLPSPPSTLVTGIAAELRHVLDLLAARGVR